jgi:hypothetical protein
MCRWIASYREQNRPCPASSKSLDGLLFYSYFKSKSDLYSEVLGCFFTDPEWKSCWEGVQVDLSSTDVGPQVVRAYLSRQHFEDVENSCPMVAGSDELCSCRVL